MGRYLLGAFVLFVAGFVTAADPELHVVAVREGHRPAEMRSVPGSATVRVDRPGKEVVLVVHGYERTAWDIGVTPGTKLTKVLALGKQRQLVTAPNGVPVEELTFSSQKAGASKTHLIGSHDTELTSFRPFVRKLAELTKLEIASFQGADQFDPERPFVVDTVQKDERLRSDFPVLPPAKERPELKIRATRLVYGPQAWADTSGFGEFTQAGPTADGFTRLPLGVSQVTYDTKEKQYYGIKGSDLYALADEFTKVTKIEPPVKLLHTPRALTYDAKRERVLIAARARVIEYSTKNGGNWEQLLTGEKSYAALAWQAKTDTLYAFGAEWNPEDVERYAPILYELKPDGRLANTITIGSPVFPGILSPYRPDTAVELIDLGTELALLVHTDDRPNSSRRGKQETFLFVIDPKTGKAKLAWKQ